MKSIRAVEVPVFAIVVSLLAIWGLAIVPPSLAAGSTTTSSETTVSGVVLNDINPAHGTVVPDGLPPVAGASVRIPSLGLSTTSESDGNFTIGAVPYTAPYTDTTIVVSAPGFGQWTLNDAPLQSGGIEVTVMLTASPQTTTQPASGSEAPAAPIPTTVTPEVSSCSNYYSNSAPPGTISVYLLREGGGVQNFDFKFYVEHVLPNEWPSGDMSAALEAGAIAVKEYGWYWVNNWRGGSYNGTCYDVDDTTNYQYFCESCATPTSTNNAIFDTWQWLARQSGAIFETSFGAGSASCANVNGAWMSQNGTQVCAEDGYLWPQIVTTFYNGVAFSANSTANAAILGGTQFVWWAGSDEYLREAWYVSGWNYGDLGFGPMTSNPGVAVDSSTEFVFWKGENNDLYEAWYSSGTWNGPVNLGFGPMASAPTVALDSSGNQYVWWEGTDENLWEVWYVNGWYGPGDIGYGPLD